MLRITVLSTIVCIVLVRTVQKNPLVESNRNEYFGLLTACDDNPFSYVLIYIGFLFFAIHRSNFIKPQMYIRAYMYFESVINFATFLCK